MAAVAQHGDAVVSRVVRGFPASPLAFLLEKDGFLSRELYAGWRSWDGREAIGWVWCLFCVRWAASKLWVGASRSQYAEHPEVSTAREFHDRSRGFIRGDEEGQDDLLFGNPDCSWRVRDQRSEGWKDARRVPG